MDELRRIAWENIRFFGYYTMKFFQEGNKNLADLLFEPYRILLSNLRRN